MNQTRPTSLSSTRSPLLTGVQKGVEKGLRTRKKAEKELVEAIGDAHDILVRATTVFPVTLFPDTITVDRTKLTVTHRDFFRVGEVLSIAIEDILNVTATVGPLFGSIKISTRFFDSNKPYTVHHFWRSDALKIKRIVQGYLIVKQQEVDTSSLTTKDLAHKLDKAGKVDRPEKV